MSSKISEKKKENSVKASLNHKWNDKDEIENIKVKNQFLCITSYSNSMILESR